MKLTIDFYRGIKHAELDINGISLIAGKNHQGKSSIAEALGSVLLGEPLPAYILKKDSTEIVNTNSGVGKIMLECEAGTSLIDYPICKLTSGGTIPKCSYEAAGMKSPVWISERERATYFSDLLKTNPMKSDLKKAVEKANMDDESFDELWKLVESLTWDGAYERCKGKGAELKGTWKHITGEQYGVNKGEIWKPEGWILGLESKKLESLNKEIDALRKERDSAITTTALDESEKKRLRSYVDGLESAKLNVKDHQTVVDKLRSDYSIYWNYTPQKTIEKNQECPHCAKPVTIENGIIVKGKKVTDAQIKAVEDKYNAYIEKGNQLQNELDKAKDSLTTAKYLLKECEDATEKWNKKPEKSKGRDASIIDKDIEIIENQSIMLQSYLEARNVHNEILATAIIVTALAPEGLRKLNLSNGILKFNKKIHELCKEAEFGVISVNSETLNFTLNGRRYELLSQSEKYRIRVIVQLAISIYDNSDIIILDGVDILDGDGRSGILRALYEIKKTALICMTMNEKTQMRNMDDVGGHSYWVEEGEIK